MIELLPRIFAYKLFYKTGFPKLLPVSYTISLTYKCNSRCSTCNVYKKTSEHMSLKEFELLFKSIGKSPYWITFSGGEPFIKEDIVDIISLAYKICKPAMINIPTNGILVNKVVDAVEQISKACPRSQIIINLSIDGVGEEHDKIRNVEGNYNKVIQTYNLLRKKNLKNVSIGIHSVISRFNVDNFTKISKTLMNLNPDQYITEIAEERVELDTIGKNISPSLLSYKAAIDFLIHRIKNTKIPKRVNRITQSFRIEYYQLVKKILKYQTQIIPCYAGVASAQISPDGDVWTCCVKAKSLGNLKKNNFDFKGIWFSKLAKKERKAIKNKECYCPLANAAYTNMLHDIPTLYRVFIRSFVKWWT
ncbi:MAG TPA: radical SAM protein [Candidatus Cloacimonadota bacterium]|nr:radical SAM protein [Candidatus Cloacimonadota bacterium]HQB41494.1 radical SAM protein [Candidatus Cloacimonadota bacterium]